MIMSRRAQLVLFASTIALPTACRHKGPIDADGDGALSDVDCNDADPAIGPDAVEVCDGVDQNCDGQTDEGVTTDWYSDGDGDGFGNDALPADAACSAAPGWVSINGDCDDSDPAINPSATELCDGVDDDCNGSPDLWVISTWYTDGDGDGWGDDSTAVESCDPSADQVEVGGDCDDTDSETNPGEVEVCGDFDDDDCNGMADVGEAATWYSDADGDGYGHPGEYEETCQPQEGWVIEGGDCRPSEAEINPGAVETCDGVDNDCNGVVDDGGDLDGDGWLSEDCDGGEDCDDTDPDVSPDGEEVCGDGLDNDCNGRDAFCGFEGTIDLSAADGKYTASYYYDAGRQLDVGDMNGDGVGDVLVATMYASSYSGGAFVAYGPLSGTHTLASSATRLEGAYTTYEAGRSIAVADIDGDGIDDAAIGAPGSNTDKAFINFGPIYAKALTASDLILTGNSATEFGHGMDVDDINGDGQADVVVGAYEDDIAGSNAGTLYIFYGPLSSGTRSGPSAADAYVVGDRAGHYMGRYLEVGGDANGDGIGDLLISSPYDSTYAPYQGSVNLVFGPISGTFDLGSADGIHRGESANNYAGEGYALADVTGDGLADGIAGALYNSSVAAYAGSAYVVEGPATGTTSLADGVTVIRATQAYSYLGTELRADDMDGDGTAELIVGASGDNTGGTGAGAAFLFLLPSTGTLYTSDAAATFVGEDGSDEAGQGIAFGDLNSDGKKDLVLGAPGESTGGGYAGAFYVLYPSW
jgi:Putative metal-binding motif/FG-GAP repeat